MSVDRHVCMEVNLSAIRNNLRALKSVIKPGSRLCSVLKADAYGHGAVQVSRVVEAEGVDYVAVATFQEAMTLRNSGLMLPILMFGFIPPEVAPLVVAHNLTSTVYDLEQARALSSAALDLGRKAKLHVKIDSGMSRIGIRPAEAGEFCTALAALPGLDIEGMYTHFACADEPDKTHAYNQLSAFKVAMRSARDAGAKIALHHCGNTAATMTMPDTHLEMSRSGCSLYGGLYPFESELNDFPVPLQGATELKGRLVQVKKLPAGSTVSYGAWFTAPKDMRLGTVPLGYSDGYTRMLSGKAHMLVAGKKVPVIGRICMDQCMIDLTDVPEAKKGDEVLIFGQGLPVRELSDALGTITWEVISMIRNRVPRVYLP
ncbi:MAG: alanine racemase [Deltaproteobacteria bacterium]|jgi:alanine racemase|nr:alanine racemase [Deltaproteobacteria bacterium]